MYIVSHARKSRFTAPRLIPGVADTIKIACHTNREPDRLGEKGSRHRELLRTTAGNNNIGR